MSDKNQKESKPGRGGRRAGSGRPKGSKDAVTVRGLLEALDQRSPNTSYEDMLIEDFLSARYGTDTALTLKYHNLILNKVLATKLEVETNESEDVIAAKQAAFAAALADLAGLKRD